MMQRAKASKKLQSKQQGEQTAGSASGKSTSSGRYAEILALQGSVGNRAVNQLLASRQNNGVSPTPTQSGILQRKCASCGQSTAAKGQCEKELPLQRRSAMTVGQPGDKYEREADAVAAKVVEQINSPTSQQPVQGKVEPVVQPTVMGDSGVGEGTVDASVEQSIQQAKGGGQELSEGVRKPMEQAFGADFSGVRVHNNSESDRLNRSLNARAFTTGQNIFFKQGEYNPATKDGQELLAHELTHVVQQKGSKTTQPKSLQSSKDQNTCPDIVIQRQPLGTFSYRSGTGDLTGEVVVHSRTVDEWKTFLKNKADEKRGNIELNAFMAAALGQNTALGGVFMNQRYSGDKPDKQDSINLMIAFLTVGEKIDLPNYFFFEGFSRARPRTAILMHEFNKKFANQAILKMTQRSEGFNLEQFNAIKAYTSEAESQSTQTPNFIRKNPVHSLIASALGSAIGATLSLTKYNRQPPKDSDENKKVDRAYNLIRNNAKVIKASIEQAQEERNTKKDILMTTFKASVEATKAALPGSFEAALSIFTPFVETFIQELLKGNGAARLRELKDGYNEAVEDISLLADFEQNAKDAFEAGIDY